MLGKVRISGNKNCIQNLIKKPVSKWSIQLIVYEIDFRMFLDTIVQSMFFNSALPDNREKFQFDTHTQKKIWMWLSYGALFFFFNGATTLCGPWSRPWFRNRKFFLGGVEIPASSPQRGELGTTFGPYSLTYLAWVALLGAYAPVSIALRVTVARSPPVHDKAAVDEEETAIFRTLKTSTKVLRSLKTTSPFEPNSKFLS